MLSENFFSQFLKKKNFGLTMNKSDTKSSCQLICMLLAESHLQDVFLLCRNYDLTYPNLVAVVQQLWLTYPGCVSD